MTRRHFSLLLLVFILPPPVVAAPSFSRQVAPLFYKLGCSAGACHGAFAGKGNFRLSLFAADADADYQAVRYSDLGRRVDRVRPERSLLLLKPTGALPHGGGVRLKPGGEEYQLLRSWIEAGMPFDTERVLSLRLEPPTLPLTGVGQSQTLRVWAKLSNGREEDATRWTRFEAVDAETAAVDDAGRVTARGAGDTAVLARYAGQVGFATVTVAGTLPPGLSFPQETLTDRIDQLLAARLRWLNLVPSPPCDDAEFLRRAYLDITGSLPLPDEARKFLADRSPDKRARLIDALLAHPLHSAVWALKVCEWVGADDRFGAPVYVWYDRLREQFQKNTPWDKIVSLDYIAGYKFNRNGDDKLPLDGRRVALQAAYAFLGVHLECAQCHKHPHDRWTQNDFFSFAQAFAYNDAKKPPGKPAEIFRDVVTGRPLPPRLLGGRVLDLKDGVSPRQEVLKWMTAKDNPYFARAMVNRVWAHYFGRGLYEPIDAQAAANPPIHPELLDELTKDFLAHNFDLRHLHRRILNTTAYGRSWRTNAGNARDERNFSHRVLRLMQAEQIVDAINQATGAPLKVTPPYAKPPPKRVIARAIELPPSRLSPTDDGYLLQIFGRPQRTQASDYERRSEASLSQVMYLYNSRELHAKIAADNGRLKKLVDTVADDRKLIEELYLLTLTRLPSPVEVERALVNLKTARSRRDGYHEILWSLFNRKEFFVLR
ncbi:MAG TPA: DUF1549 and DUF1553 domain-containing protein [Gemmataceae bacterium]